ncbi:MAG: bifunctional DNA primase/polymerase [Gemmatimonadota bacterium]
MSPAASTVSPALDRMLRARRHYTDALGFGLTLLDGKRPIRPAWQEDPLDPETVDRGIRQGNGLGCVHRQSGTAALDLDRPLEEVAVALAAVGVDLPALLEAPGPKTVGNPDNPWKPWYQVPEGYDLGRRALRWPDPEDPTQRVVVLELRAGSVQDVLPPTSHPDTGKPYEWEPTPPLCREDLPLVPGLLLGIWLAWDLLLPRMEAACPWVAEEPTPTRETARTQGRSSSEYDGPDVIQAWNERVPVGTMLERNGYKKAGSRRWIAPSSKTGMPGVFLCDTGRIYSYHESDALASPHAHDSFGLLTELEHGGDAKEAARAAALELGMDVEPARSGAVTVLGGAR